MTAWSFSGLTAYNTCPRKYYETKLTGNFVEESGPEAIWGNDVHVAIEYNIRNGLPLSGRMEAFKSQVEKVKAATVNGTNYTELKLGITKELAPCDFDAEDCWARCIIDFLHINGVKGLNIDWKTGKVKPSNQLRMSSAIAMAHFPEIEVVTSAFVWLAHNKTTNERFHRGEPLLDVFKPTLSEMEWSASNGAYPPRPSGLCAGWCPVTTCEFHRPKRR